MSNVIAIDDRDGRLKARASIEQLLLAIQEEEDSKRGIADELNDNGLDEWLVNRAYVRSIKVPARVTFISELWNRERLWMMLSGTMHVRSELGDSSVTAPNILMAPYGSRVAAYAETDVQFAAVTGCPEADDVSQCEDIICASDYGCFSYPWDTLEAS